MATVRKTITVSETQDSWIKSRIADGHFANDSDYIRDLVRKDQSRQDRSADLKQAIAEGLESGLSNHSLSDIWDAAEDRHRAMNG